MTFSLKVDEWLLNKSAKKRLGFDSAQENAIRNVAEICNYVTRYFMETEQNFFADYGLTEIIDCYDDLLNQIEGLSASTFVSR